MTSTTMNGEYESIQVCLKSVILTTTTPPNAYECKSLALTTTVQPTTTNKIEHTFGMLLHQQRTKTNILSSRISPPTTTLSSDGGPAAAHQPPPSITFTGIQQPAPPTTTTMSCEHGFLFQNLGC